MKAKMRRANDLYVDGGMDNVEHKQVDAPLREKVQILEANSAEGGCSNPAVGRSVPVQGLHKAGHAKRLFGGSQFPPAWT